MARSLSLWKMVTLMNKGVIAVIQFRSLQLRFSTIALGLTVLTGCVPLSRPTLDQVRLGQGRGPAASDTILQPGETRAEVVEMNPSRREIRVRADDGRIYTLEYDPNRTRVTYHGRDYSIDKLEAGDIIAFQTPPRDRNFADTIRIQEPVQARAGSVIAGRSPLPARADVVEGTVERIDPDLGVFEVKPRTGRTVTVSIPYNARPADVENFRRLRRGDYVRVEGQFVHPDNLHLQAFVSPR
jgi:hypothetical protein